MKIGKAILAAVALMVLAGSAVPADAQYYHHHRHYRHHHHHHYYRHR